MMFAFAGVTLGAYLEPDALKAVSGEWLPVLLVSAGTLVVSMAVGLVLERRVALDGTGEQHVRHVRESGRRDERVSGELVLPGAQQLLADLGDFLRLRSEALLTPHARHDLGQGQHVDRRGDDHPISECRLDEVGSPLGGGAEEMLARDEHDHEIGRQVELPPIALAAKIVGIGFHRVGMLLEQGRAECLVFLVERLLEMDQRAFDVDDDAAAAAWFARAAGAGMADAQVALAELHVSGRGVPRGEVVAHHHGHCRRDVEVLEAAAAALDGGEKV